MSAGIRRIAGRAIPFGRDNVDTDLIIPAAYLKTVTRSGLGRFAFAPVRREPGNVFDDPDLAGAPILIAGENFGCGSSREHAVWALADLGVQAVIAPSFSDIFAGNAFRNGLVAVAVDAAAAARLLTLAPDNEIEVDLEGLEVRAAGETFPFSLDPFRRDCLMQGIDEIGLTLAHEAGIAAFEARGEAAALRTAPLPPAAAAA